MKLSNSMRAATLALGLTTAACGSDNDGPQLSAETAAEMEQPTATPTVTPAPTPTQVVQPVPTPAPTQAQQVPAPTAPAPVNNVPNVWNQTGANSDAFDKLCNPDGSQPKGGSEYGVVDGENVYLLCVEGHDRVVKVLDHGKETDAASHVKDASAKEDKLGNDYYAVTTSGRNHCNNGDRELKAKVVPGAEDQKFYDHPLFSTLGIDKAQLPFTPSAKLVEFVDANFKPCSEIKSATPGNPSQPSQPVQPKPQSVVINNNKDREQDIRIGALEHEAAIARGERENLRKDVDKVRVDLNNFNKKTPFDLNAMHDEAANKKD